MDIELFDLCGVARERFAGARGINPMIGERERGLIKIAGISQVPGMVGMDRADDGTKGAVVGDGFLHEAAKAVGFKIVNRAVRSDGEAFDVGEFLTLVEVGLSSESDIVAERFEVVDDALDALAFNLRGVGQFTVIDGKETGEEFGPNGGTLGNGAVEAIHHQGFFGELVDVRGAGEFGTSAAKGIVTDIVANDDEDVGLFACGGETGDSENKGSGEESEFHGRGVEGFGEDKQGV